MQLKRSEAAVKRAVCELLKARGILSFRMNAGDRFGSYKGRTWKIEGHPSGTADILALPHEVYWNDHEQECYKITPLWLELKSSTGKQSREQKQFQEMVEKEGHTYILVRSASEVEDWLKANT